METDELQSVKKAVVAQKVIIGTKLTLKSIKNGSLHEVVYTKNTPDFVKKDIIYYCSLRNIPARELSLTNKELGVVCRKPFHVSVLAIKP
ncbi:MAG: ribosomal L7Ae/L30e/S12e/Gadd45 family protein [Candidatus Woesearchaeota archaeon]